MNLFMDKVSTTTLNTYLSVKRQFIEELLKFSVILYVFIFEIIPKITNNILLYHMANWSTMRRSIMIGSLSGPNFTAKRTGKIAAHELISLLL